MWTYNYEKEAFMKVVINTKNGSARGVGVPIIMGGVMEKYPKR